MTIVNSSELVNLKKRRNLAADLDAVLTANKSDAAAPENIKQLKQILVQQLVPGRLQPRRDFPEELLKELADSIKEHGILQPILARKISGGEYEIIAGERRWRAAQMAGLQQVPIIVGDFSDQSVLALGLIENLQRQDLNPIEEATALKQLIEDFQMTHEQVAQAIGRSRVMVTNRLRLLRLATSVQTLLIEKQLDVGHAKILLGLDEKQQEDLAYIIIKKDMSVREAEKLVQNQKNKLLSNAKPKKTYAKCDEWSTVLSEKFCSKNKAEVKLNEQGKGKVVIYIESSDEVEWLLERLDA